MKSLSFVRLALSLGVALFSRKAHENSAEARLACARE